MEWFITTSFLFQSFITLLCTKLCATFGLVSICPHIIYGEDIQIHYAAGVLTTLVHCGATKFQTCSLITAFDWPFSSPGDTASCFAGGCLFLFACLFFTLFIYTEIVPVTLPRIGTFPVLSSPTSVPFLMLRTYFSHSFCFSYIPYSLLSVLCTQPYNRYLMKSIENKYWLDG